MSDVDHGKLHNVNIVNSKLDFNSCLINHKKFCNKECYTWSTSNGPRVILKCMCGYSIVSNHDDQNER